MTTPSATIFIVPGWRDSGPGHWQSLWAERFANTVPVRQDDWLKPTRSAWVDSLTRTILEQSGQVVIAAHSLGCITTTHLPPEAVARIQGALLVASSNDPFCPVRLTGAYTRGWGSEFVRLQNAGHIHVDSGHGEWPLGVALLQSLLGDEALRVRKAPPPPRIQRAIPRVRPEVAHAL